DRLHAPGARVGEEPNLRRPGDDLQPFARVRGGIEVPTDVNTADENAATVEFIDHSVGEVLSPGLLQTPSRQLLHLLGDETAVRGVAHPLADIRPARARADCRDGPPKNGVPQLRGPLREKEPTNAPHDVTPFRDRPGSKQLEGCETGGA